VQRFPGWLRILIVGSQKATGLADAVSGI